MRGVSVWLGPIDRPSRATTNPVDLLTPRLHENRPAHRIEPRPRAPRHRLTEHHGPRCAIHVALGNGSAAEDRYPERVEITPSHHPPDRVRTRAGARLQRIGATRNHPPPRPSQRQPTPHTARRARPQT